MAETNRSYAFSIYRHDVHAGDGGSIAQARYRTIAEVLAHPFQDGEEYWIHVRRLSRYLPREEFEDWAAGQLKR
jgi:hypothetical protein